jgi:hypothetical protein
MPAQVREEMFVDGPTTHLSSKSGTSLKGELQT